MNYFELFEMQPTPHLSDHTTVVKKFQQLQKSFHPDFFTQADEDEKETALQKSAAANEAYKIFKNKYSLLAYYLQQKNALVHDEKYNLPPDFLMEMMELNEAADERAGDSNEIATQYLQRLEQEASPVLTKNPAEHTPQDLENLKAFYFKTKYILRLLDRN